MDNGKYSIYVLREQQCPEPAPVLGSYFIFCLFAILLLLSIIRVIAIVMMIMLMMPKIRK